MLLHVKVKVIVWCPCFIAKVKHQFKCNAFLIFQLRKQTVTTVILKTASITQAFIS